MDKESKYHYAIYGVLLFVSAALLAWENYSLSWLWLFVLTCFAFVTLLNDFLLKEQYRWNWCLTIIQCALALLLAYTMAGYGSIPLTVVVQVGLPVRYSKKASAWISFALCTLLLCALYMSQKHDLTSVYPGIFIALSFLIVLLLLFAIKDSARLQRDHLQRITQLQLSKKELRDLNRQMKHYSEEMEKITILRERNRMSKQIHDTLGHVLTAVSVQLGAAELLLAKNPDEALIKITNAKTQTHEGLRSIKEALSLIDEDSIQFEDRLFDTIRKAETSMNSKVLAQISVKNGLSLSVQDFLISALKEGITNGVRHGGASAFVFRLDTNGEGTVFHLEDNGKGCDKINMGYGLTAMERQAQEYGGILDAHSVKEEGFVLKIAIPRGGLRND